jgi:hypothetical protein
MTCKWQRDPHHLLGRARKRRTIRVMQGKRENIISCLDRGHPSTFHNKPPRWLTHDEEDRLAGRTKGGRMVRKRRCEGDRILTSKPPWASTSLPLLLRAASCNEHIFCCSTFFFFYCCCARVQFCPAACSLFVIGLRHSVSVSCTGLSTFK